ncbi:hypothetical protein K432DRAFT_398859 [Lepidopterella palustris CBS 459.81]|uniref:Uncharacterized protein n=1 Tax=Lepidopterella palustris CBS 459.81 TaxID=1314670 RepID=A0A8E2DXC5_9PEZI|nr:hypothetical protein K432DRAFT_398859 [Lepidopterella palustris CBS 459.81]
MPRCTHVSRAPLARRILIPALSCLFYCNILKSGSIAGFTGLVMSPADITALSSSARFDHFDRMLFLTTNRSNELERVITNNRIQPMLKYDATGKMQKGTVGFNLRASSCSVI